MLLAPETTFGLSHRLGRSLDCHPGTDRFLRDAVFVLHPRRVDLLHHERDRRLHPAPQAARRCRPYRMCGYPYTLWLFVAVSIWFMVNACVTEPLPSLMAFVIVAAGVLAYRLRGAGAGTGNSAGRGPALK
jgi:hypothetical protein